MSDDIFWSTALRPLVFVLLASFLLAIKNIFTRFFPDGKIKKLLLRELWLADHERHARERAGIFAPPKPVRARSLAWAAAGRRVGAWVRKKLF